MSSRICVKGLPRDLTDEKFRKLFADKGVVTDAKIMRTGAGVSRQFGFIGYKTVEEAHDAVQYFDRTFIGTHRINVTIAEQLASRSLSRPWSKYSAGSSAYQQLHEGQEGDAPKLKAREAKQAAKRKRAQADLPDDPKLREFLRVMDRRSTAIWSNEDAALLEPALPGQPLSAHRGAVGGEAQRDPDSEDDEEYQELPTADGAKKRKEESVGKEREQGKEGKRGKEGTQGKEGKRGKEGKQGTERRQVKEGKEGKQGKDREVLRGSKGRAGGGEEGRGGLAAVEEGIADVAAPGRDARASKGLGKKEKKMKEAEAEEEGVGAAAVGRKRRRDAAGAGAVVERSGELRKSGGGEEEEDEDGVGQGAKGVAEKGRKKKKKGENGAEHVSEAEGRQTQKAAKGGRSKEEKAGGEEGKKERKRKKSKGEEASKAKVENGEEGKDCSGDVRRADAAGKKQEPAGSVQPPVVDEAMSDMDYLRSRICAVLEDDLEDEDDDSDEDGDNVTDHDSHSEGDNEGLLAEGSSGTGRSKDNHAGSPEDVGSGDEDSADDDDDESEDEDEDDDEVGATRQQAQEGDAEVRVEETGRLFLRNLAYTATQADLAQLLQQFGELSEVHLVVDRRTKKSKGIALASFMEAADAAAALQALDGSIFQGRLLHVLPGRQAPAPRPVVETEGEGGKGKGSSFKADREASRKAEAGKRASWNTLYMRPDTLVQAAAALLGTTAAALLDPDSEDLAATQAKAEALVLNRTKAALEAAGVSVPALEAAAEVSGHAAKAGSVPRSPTALLVKNLPYSTSEAKLLDMFGKHGALGRLALPATNTLAVVEFLDAADARRAFSSLAYRRFEGVPLYLEWAPQEIFQEGAPTLALKGVREAAVGALPDQATEDAELAHHTGGTEEAEEREDADGESPTLYVKNLGFSTTDKALQEHFDSAVSAAGGYIRSARITRKKGPDGKLLSAGFGFVECSSEAVARAVLKKMQGSVLDGRALQLQLSMRRTAGAEPAPAPDKKTAKSTKLVVRNVAFEATKKDIQSLFSGFGHIRSVRLPRKFDHSHRGFAFVDFLTKQEALNAKEAVAGAHLYGRRLVIEWAEDEEGLDTLRAKTAARFRPDGNVQASMPLATRFRLAHEGL